MGFGSELCPIIDRLIPSAVFSPSVKPGFYSKNLLMLGKTYLALKDKENAHLWLTKARDYRPITTEDKEVGLSHTQWDGTLENNTYS